MEAAWRSGALSTAAHAGSLLRPVGAVPGPVTSAASAGCHRLLRENDAVCITDAAEAAELVGDLGSDLAPEPSGGAGPRSQGAPPSGLDELESRVFEALPLRGRAGVAALARASGLAEPDVEIALAFLELAGLAGRATGGWGRCSRGARGQSLR